MLQTAAPFPNPGCTAFLRGTGAEARLIQRNADGSAVIKLERPRFLSPAEKIEWNSRGASLTTRVPAADLYATQEDAIHCGRKRRATRTRRTR